MAKLSETIFMLEIKDNEGTGISVHKTRVGALGKACCVIKTDDNLPTEVVRLINSNQLADAVFTWNALRPNIGKISIHEVVLFD
jgi:hypothetical protein